MDSRYLIIVLGFYKNIEEDLNHIANSDYGVHFVDGNGIFMGTFYSPYTTQDIYDLLLHIPAFLVFDISKHENNAINLPSKYFKGLFPEYEETLNKLQKDLHPELRTDTVVDKEEYDNIDDILDKLSRNEYNRNCLTEKELKILDNFAN
jgi:hypothetical protein